jgi:hypothetical protein
VVAARLVKGRLERTTLGQVAADIAIAFKPGAWTSLVQAGSVCAGTALAVMPLAAVAKEQHGIGSSRCMGCG